MRKKYYFAILKESATDTTDNQIIGWSAIEANTLPACETAAGMKAVPLPDSVANEWHDLTMGIKGAVALSNGQIVPHAPPPVPLRQQAQQAFQSAQQEFGRLQMMGSTFGSQMQAYMRHLDAIINGTDTSSTVLPAAPDDPTT